MPIIHNQRNGKAVVRVTGTGVTEQFVVAANATVNSAFRVDADEVVNGVDFNLIQWSGSVTISNGGTQVFNLGPTPGVWDLAGAGNAIPATWAAGANLVITTTGAATVLVELSKNTNMVTEY